MSETKFWTGIQEERGCPTCFFFDKTRVGQARFCTYAFRLCIEQKDGKETCLTRKEK